jgi:hypothetical protein
LRTQKPIYSAQVAENMDRSLAQFEQEEALDDEFFSALSPDGKHIVTGGYNKTAHIVDTNATMNTSLECNFVSESGLQAGQTKLYNKNKRILGLTTHNEDIGSNLKKSANKIDSTKQVALGAWSPQIASTGNHTLALGYRNCVYIYEGSTRLNSGRGRSSLSRQQAKLV